MPEEFEDRPPVTLDKADRSSGEGLGGVAGMFFGFFGGVGLVCAWESSHNDMPDLLRVPVMALLVFGGAALLGLAGASLGRRFLPVIADDMPVASPTWPVLGMFAGVFAGFLLGLKLGEWVFRSLRFSFRLS